MQAPLVGSPAPDFTATSVFDQEFVDTKLSDYKVGCCYREALGGTRRGGSTGCGGGSTRGQAGT